MMGDGTKKKKKIIKEKNMVLLDSNRFESLITEPG